VGHDAAHPGGPGFVNRDLTGESRHKGRVRPLYRRDIQRLAMYGSAFVYLGTMVALFGLMHVIKPIRRLRVPTRRRGLAIAGSGAVLAVAGLFAPVFEQRAMRPNARLDEFVPSWQFHEIHTLRISAPPDRVYDAIKAVRADEILLFRALTWIRRGGRPAPRSMMNAGSERPIIEVATNGGFVSLADDPPREIVIGTVVAAPRGPRPPLTRDTFRSPPPGYAVAAMNFVVTADGTGGSVVSTETRVNASGAPTRRRFAVYWRLIYPGSALIRRMWLRAIQKRVEAS
jgi:hypothetical protein